MLIYIDINDDTVNKVVCTTVNKYFSVIAKIFNLDKITWCIKLTRLRAHRDEQKRSKYDEHQL